MNFLEQRIVKDGIVKSGNVLKVDSFLNHQMDMIMAGIGTLVQLFTVWKLGAKLPIVMNLIMPKDKES